jgi:hypothetical protein
VALWPWDQRVNCSLGRICGDLVAALHIFIADMLTAAAALSIAFSPNAMPMQGSRTAVRSSTPLMAEEASSRYAHKHL